MEARRQHPTLKGDKDRSSVCILRPTERILTTKWVLSTIAMPKPTPCASPGTAAVGEGQREVPDSVALTGTQKSQAAPVGGPSGRVLKRRGSQMSRARASISRIGHRLSDALRGAVPEEQRMQKAVDGFLHAWARNGWVKLVPLHSQHEVEAIWKRCLWGVRLPITKLQRCVAARPAPHRLFVTVLGMQVLRRSGCLLLCLDGALYGVVVASGARWNHCHIRDLEYRYVLWAGNMTHYFLTPVARCGVKRLCSSVQFVCCPVGRLVPSVRTCEQRARNFVPSRLVSGFGNASARLLHLHGAHWVGLVAK